MKQFILSLILLLLSFSGQAQKLKYNQLLKLQQMEKHEVANYLQKKGWTTSSDSAPTEETMGKAVWAFSPQGANATAWLIFYYNPTSPNRILYNASGSPAFYKIRKKVEEQSEMVTDAPDKTEQPEYVDAYFDFVKDEHVFRLLTYTQPNYFGIKIFKKEDYQKAKKNGRL